jgi:hypothetical protein
VLQFENLRALLPGSTRPLPFFDGFVECVNPPDPLDGGIFMLAPRCQLKVHEGPA